MTREIKFRAWNEITKKMFYFDMSDLAYGDDGCYSSKQHEERLEWSDLEDNLMQYTGLKDKNGKEIYEGDIMKYCVHYPQDFQDRNPLKKYGRIAGGVQWIKGWLWLDYNAEKDDGTLLYENSAKEWEIIGNIYENPELLK